MPAHLDDLIARLSDADPSVRLRAAQDIAELREDALPALNALTIAVDDAQLEVRLAAVHALGVLDPVEAEMALYWASQSTDFRVQKTAQALLDATADARGPHSTVWRDPSLTRSE